MFISTHLIACALPRVLLALAASACASASAATVEVHVSGVAAAKGKIAVAVCDRAHFLKTCAYSASVPAQAGENVVRLAGVPAGTWAVTVYHDENDNGKLDTNFLGIPSEPYGFSRDARGHFGPPAFEDAAIEVSADPAVVALRVK